MRVLEGVAAARRELTSRGRPDDALSSRLRNVRSKNGRFVNVLRFAARPHVRWIAEKAAWRRRTIPTAKMTRPAIL